MATVISIVSYPFLPAKVGGQRGIALFNKYFSHYHQLICVTTRKNDPRAAEGYEVLNILSDSSLRYINILYFFKIRNIIRKYRATHLLLEHPYYGWLGVLLKWFAGVKLIVHSHNLEGLRWKTLGKWWWRVLWSYEKFTHRMANYNFFIHDEDRIYAVRNFKLNPSRCITMTYGIEWKEPPSSTALNQARTKLRNKLDIDQAYTLILFNGAFNYSPNSDALQRIIDSINPLLEQQAGFEYLIIICGRDIPKEISKAHFSRIRIEGFVDDLGLYCMGSDLFINPVVVGGGIKTKLVEAIGYNMNAVSTQNGAQGVDPAICNGKLKICEDNDWLTFVRLIVESNQYHANTPSAFFDQFYWGNTTARAAAFIE